MGFDCASHQIVLDGGYTGPGPFSGQTWSYDGANWTLLSTGGTGRRGGSITWDESRQQLLRFGGETSQGTWSSDSHIWNGTAWVVAPSVVAPTPIGGRSYHSASYDPQSQSVLVFGGHDGAAVASLADTWSVTPQHPPRIDDTGPGCNPAAPLVPQISRVCGTGPWIGTTLDLDVINLPGFPSFNIWFADTVNPTLPLPGGCSLLTGLGYSLFGTTQFSLPIPNNPIYCGAELYFQTVSLDLSQPVLAPGFITAMSNGLRVTIGTR